MVNDLWVKRLLTQAGVSVLAGLLMSSAVMAEDMGGIAGEVSDSSIGEESGDPDTGDAGGEIDGGDLGDPADPSDGTDDGAGDGTDGGEEPGDPGTDPTGQPGDEGGDTESGDGATDEGGTEAGNEDGTVEVTFETTGMPVNDGDSDFGAPVDPGIAENRGGPSGQASGGNAGETGSHMRLIVK